MTEAKGIGNQSGGGGGGGGADQENGFLSPRGRLVADERTNTLMISDIPKKVAQMRELINVIDRPVDPVKGDGPCNTERIAHRKQAWDDGAWVREAAMAYAEKTGGAA